MESVVLIVLGGAGVALLTSALRSRNNVPRSSMVSFRRSMAALGRHGRMHHRSGTAGRRVLVLQDPQRVAGPRGRPSRAGARGPARASRADSGTARARTAAPGPGAAAPRGAPPPRPRQTAAARRRSMVLRALIVAVLGSSVAWATLGTVGGVLLVVSLAALVAYGLLLVSIAPAPPSSRRAPPRGGRAAEPRAGARAAGAEPAGAAQAGQGGGRRDEPVAHGA